MSRVVAFLRGINVGSHIVKKEKLQEAFVALGFKGVVTYKQSGNIIFETEIGNMGEVRARIEDKLRKALGYDVPVFLRTIPQLKSIVKKNSRPVSEGTTFWSRCSRARPASPRSR